MQYRSTTESVIALHGINWGALDHASHAPQLMSCNYYMYV